MASGQGVWGHSWPAGGRENASLKNTLRSSPKKPRGCGTSCYFEPQGRKPTNKCSETIQTPQRANTSRSRVKSVVWVFVVQWSENQTITQVIVNGSMEWIIRDDELGQGSVSCFAGLHCSVMWSCSSTGDWAERRSTGERMWWGQTHHIQKIHPEGTVLQLSLENYIVQP